MKNDYQKKKKITVKISDQEHETFLSQNTDTVQLYIICTEFNHMKKRNKFYFYNVFTVYIVWAEMDRYG